MLKADKSPVYHPGPFGKIPARASIFGVLFAAAFIFLVWIGLPDYRWFWTASGIGGIVVAGVLYLWHKRRASKEELIELSMRTPRPPR
jgi:hypothetical protein